LLKHTGTYVFDYSTQDKLYKDLHEIVVAHQATQPAPAEPVKAEVVATNKPKKDKKKPASAEATA